MAIAIDKSAYPANWKSAPRIWLGAGIVFAIVLLLTLPANPKQFYQSYFYGWVFWLTFTMGCFGWQLLHNIIRGSWGRPVIRIWEAGAKMLPVMFLLYIPILIGQHHLYPWADAARVQADPKLLHRAGYMNPTYVAARTIVYFGFWSFIAYFLASLAVLQDRTGDLKYDQLRVNTAAPVFVLFVLSATFAFTDWVMSLDAHWYSTIYGFWFLDMCGLTAMAFTALLVSRQRMARQEPYITTIDNNVSRDLGNLMLTTTMVWAYFSISQYLITWSGNLPDEITYFVQRNAGNVKVVSCFLILFSFFVPFLLLLSGRNKRTPLHLILITLLILAVRVVDIWWVVVPAFNNINAPGNLHTGLFTQLNWTQPVALLAIGGIWLFGFFTFLKQSPLTPEPPAAAAEEVLAHG